MLNDLKVNYKVPLTSIFIIIFSLIILKYIALPRNYFSLSALPIYLFIGLYFSYKKPVIAFVIYFTLALNMGVLLDFDTFHLPGFFKFRDLMFLMTFTPLISPKIKKINLKFKNPIIYLLLFSLYFIFVTLNLSYHNESFISQLIYFRSIHYWLSFIPAYIILSQNKNLEKAIIIMLKISFIASLMVIIQFLVPSIRISRVIYSFNDIYATGDYNKAFIVPALGYVYFFQFIGLGFYLMKTKYKEIGLLVFIMMIVILALSSGRTALAKMLFCTLIILYVYQNLTTRSSKRIIFLIVFLTILFFIDEMWRLIGITQYLKILVGSGLYETLNLQGTFGTRFLDDLPDVISLIRRSPLIGNGVFIEIQTRFNVGSALVDLGLIGLIASYGLIGTFLILMPYFKLFSNAYRLIKIKKNLVFNIEMITLLVIFSFYFSYLVFFWTFNGYAFSSRMGMYLFGIVLAFFYVSLNHIQLNLQIKKK